MRFLTIENYLKRNAKSGRFSVFFLKIAVFFCIIVSCSNEKKIKSEILKIPVSFKIDRFDQKFENLSQSNLQDLKKEYPFLFPAKYADSIWFQKSKDTIQQEIHREIKKILPDLTNEEEELQLLYKHVKYYFPEIKEPKVICITSDVDYHNKVVVTKDLILVSLDTYLGSDHHFYESIQKYIKQGFEREYIVADVASKYAQNIVGPIRNRTFLDNLIAYGKQLYLKDLFLPMHSDAIKMDYTAEKYEWATLNEEEIWRYFIERQLLYSTDPSLLPRFLNPGPFSKFYLEEIDGEAPDRLGRFIGWKIVNAYMKNNNVSLRQLILADAETIFENSKYKPER